MDYIWPVITPPASRTATPESPALYVITEGPLLECLLMTERSVIDAIYAIEAFWLTKTSLIIDSMFIIRSCCSML